MVPEFILYYLFIALCVKAFGRFRQVPSLQINTGPAPFVHLLLIIRHARNKRDIVVHEYERGQSIGTIIAIGGPGSGPGGGPGGGGWH